MNQFRPCPPVPADVMEAARKVELYMAQQGLIGFGGLALRKDADAGRKLADAVVDLVQARGRYHTEQNYEALRVALKKYKESVK